MEPLLTGPVTVVLLMCFSPSSPYLSYATPLSFLSPSPTFLTPFAHFVSFSGPTTPTFSLSHRWSSHAAELPYPELAALPFSGRWETLLLEISS